MFLRVLARGRVGFRRKALDGLLLAVFPNLKLLGSEVADIVALLVGDHGIYEHQFGLGTDDASRVGGSLRASQGIDSRQREQRGETKHALKTQDRTSTTSE